MILRLLDPPLGEPCFIPSQCPTGGSYPMGTYPWMTNWGSASDPMPNGVGKNSAWRDRDTKFRFWKRGSGPDAKKTFQRLGPFYDDQNGEWSPRITKQNLRKFARVGYTPVDPQYEDLDINDTGLHFKIEAGGNDLLLMRMLLTEIGELPPPSLPDRNVKHKTLPIPGKSPW